MPYEVCYRALLSISVVEGLKPHTSHDRRARSYRNVSVFRFHPQDSLAGGPPARWFVMLFSAKIEGVRSFSPTRSRRPQIDAVALSLIHI